MKFNKGLVEGNVVGLIVILVSFFSILIFYSDLNSQLSSTSDDIICETVISIQDSILYKSSDLTSKISGYENFFDEILVKCKIDKLEYPETKLEVQATVADRMASCWNRYGEGEYDFLGNFDTTGNWCFLCGEFTPNTNYDEDPITYKEFVLEYTDEEIYEKKGKEEVTYYDHMNMRYVDVERSELQKINTDLKELLSDEDVVGDSNFKDILMVTTGQYKVLEDLYLKEIDPNERGFIVYRYNRIELDAQDAAINAATGTAAGIGVAVLAESLLWGGIGVISCGGTFASLGLLGPILGPICGFSVVKTTTSVVKTGSRVGKGLKALTKLKDFSQNVGSKVKFSKNRVVSSLGKFKGGSDELLGIATKVEKVDPDLAENLRSTYDILKKYDIEDVSQVSSKLDGLQEGRVAFANEFLEISRKDVFRKSSLLNDFENAKNIDEGLLLKIDELKKVERDLADLDLLDPLVPVQQPVFDKVKNYVQGIFIVGAGVAGGTVASTYNGDNIQYVDYLNEEQYYRLCGTVPPLNVES